MKAYNILICSSLDGEMMNEAVVFSGAFGEGEGIESLSMCNVIQSCVM